MGVASMLSVADRNRLRSIVKRVHLRHYPADLLTDFETDRLIDSFSEQVIEANLKTGRDMGIVE